MNPLTVLENGLFALGQVLRLPVMTLLWVCVGAALFMVGGVVVEFLLRRRERSGFSIERWLAAGGVLAGPAERYAMLPAEQRALLEQILKARDDDTLGDGGLEHIVLAGEERTRARLNGSRMLVKVGPSLGLIGTLIPMGTALAALANGNLEAMSGQMIVAFTTTIIGIASGTIAFVVTMVRTGWVQESVREQRFIAERVAAELAEDAHVDDRRK